MTRPARSRPTETGPVSFEATRVFVSYSHDSPAHERRVFQLADRLRHDGVDCELDQFEEAPDEGWPAWMGRQLREAKYVLVVCTAAYLRRLSGRERDGVGLGARWEGSLITQDLYERGGKNDKFIPIVFERGHLEEIPDFLRHTTYYDLSDPPQYDKLYRRLTAQPGVVKRPLGVVRQLPPEALDAAADTADDTQFVKRSTKSGREPSATRGGDGARATRDTSRPTTKSARSAGASSLALIRESSGRTHFVPLASVEVRDVVTAVLRPDTGADRAYLENLAASRFGLPTVDFAFGLTALRARLTSVVRTFEGGNDRFTLTLADASPQGGGVMEMGTTGYSADDIAALRARRILLDERLPAQPRRPYSRSDDSMLETLVRGLRTSMPVERSPLPELYHAMGASGATRFIAAAKLTAVLWLRLTGTVAHALDLDLRLKSRNALAVQFRGERARIYSNKEPEVITVEGTCPVE